MILGKKIKGYSMGIIAAASYGLNPLFALPLYEGGMEVNSVLLFRYMIGVPIVALIAYFTGEGFRVKMKELPLLAFLGLMMGYSSLSLFESYNWMDSSIASTMLFVYPLMVSVIMSVVFKEKFTFSTATCLVLGMAGMAFLYNGKPGATLHPMGVFWVLTSALSYALVLVGINRSTLATMPSNKLTFYLLAFGFTIFIGQALVTGHVTTPSAPLMWGNLLGLGLLPTAISLMATAVAIHAIGSTPTALLGVFEPVTAVFCGVMVFGEELTGRDMTGLTLIIMSVMLVIAQGFKKKPSNDVEIETV